MNNYIPVSEPLLIGNEKKYLSECIDTGWISSEGPFVKKFEDEFAKRVGRKYGISFVNGTAALEIAAKVAGISKDDEVIIPSFTIISCAQAISNLGGKIKPVDCSPIDFNIKVSDIEKNITSRTKAIMPVHIYGLPVDMNPLIELAEKYNLKIIEDAAEMHGQTYFGKPCGSFGDLSVFSFYANKIITTGEGGMIVCDDEETAVKCRYFRNLCFETSRRFIHNDIGYNYRFTNIQAAIGLAQLERIDHLICLKRKIGATYNSLFASNELLQLPLERNAASENIYWVYPLVLKDEFRHDAIYVMNELHKRDIGTRPFFYPLHLQPVLKELKVIDNDIHLPNSERIAERGFYIPSSMGLTEEKLEYIAGSLNNIVK